MLLALLGVCEQLLNIKDFDSMSTDLQGRHSSRLESSDTIIGGSETALQCQLNFKEDILLGSKAAILLLEVRKQLLNVKFIEMVIMNGRVGVLYFITAQRSPSSFGH